MDCAQNALKNSTQIHLPPLIINVKNAAKTKPN